LISNLPSKQNSAETIKNIVVSVSGANAWVLEMILKRILQYPQVKITVLTQNPTVEKWFNAK